MRYSCCSCCRRSYFRCGDRRMLSCQALLCGYAENRLPLNLLFASRRTTTKTAPFETRQQTSVVETDHRPPPEKTTGKDPFTTKTLKFLVCRVVLKFKKNWQSEHPLVRTIKKKRYLETPLQDRSQHHHTHRSWRQRLALPLNSPDILQK